MAIFGNTGSGKSYAVASFVQSLFYSSTFNPYRANYVIFDSYGEYHNAFERLREVNPNYQFKYYTTNVSDRNGEVLKIPLWLLDIDDFALLLQAEKHSQLQIIEKALDYKEDEQNKYFIYCSSNGIIYLKLSNDIEGVLFNDVVVVKPINDKTAGTPVDFAKLEGVSLVIDRINNNNPYSIYGEQLTVAYAD